MTDNAAAKNGGKLLHAYIVTGGSAASREERAKRIAMGAVCEKGGMDPCGVCSHCRKAAKNFHPDIIFVDKHEDKSEFTVDIIRTVRSEAYIMPNEADRKVYIIRGADIMNKEAQNAILKILEEPPSFVVFLILAENPASLLPTVRSRCAVISVKAEEKGVSDEAAEFVDAVCRGDDMKILSFCVAAEKSSKEDFREVLDEIRRAAVAKARSGGDAERLTKLTDALADAEKYMTVNVSRMHMTAKILSELV